MDQSAPDDVTDRRVYSASGAVEIKKFLLTNEKLRVFNFIRLHGSIQAIQLPDTPTRTTITRWHSHVDWTVRPSAGAGVAYMPTEYAGVWMSQGWHVSISRLRWIRSFDFGVLSPRLVFFVWF